jgi:Putative bacterial sensory transduction regulator
MDLLTRSLFWVAIATSGTAQIAAQTVTAKDPQTLAATLQAEGYAAKLEKTSDGDPAIRSKSSGSEFAVFFYNCEKGEKCATIQFHAGFDTDDGKGPSLQKINAWNQNNRFGRAYLDDEGDPHIEMDVDLDDGGMSRELFVDNFEYWTAVMSKFEEHIGW